jgi:hypothetical protein
MKDLALNGNRTGETVEFFCKEFGDLQGGSLLNLANPVQNPYFFGEFPQNFQKEAFVLVAVPKRISHFGEISSQEKKTTLCWSENIRGKKYSA